MSLVKTGLCELFVTCGPVTLFASDTTVAVLLELTAELVVFVVLTSLALSEEAFEALVLFALLVSDAVFLISLCLVVLKENKISIKSLPGSNLRSSNVLQTLLL